MAGITASVSAGNQITASVGETKIDVAVGAPSAVAASVSGGVGPTGSSGVISVSAPITNAGTSTSAQIGLSVGSGLTVSGGSLALASHTHTASQISDFTSAVVAAAPPTTDASLLTTGTLPDQRLSANIARTSDVSSAVASLVNSAPATLDTLKELSDALGADPNFATTVTNALAAKAPIASPTFTGTVGGITKSMVGLGNVDNTSDANKPISAATQTALDGKAAASHASTHAAGGSDELELEGGQVRIQAGVNASSLGADTNAATFLHTLNANGIGPALAAVSYSLPAHTHNASDINAGTLSASRLPIAAAGTLGAVRIGSGISIDGDGIISASAGYTLPTASASVLGGVKIGSGVNIDGNGVISVSTAYAAASHTHAISDVTDLATTLSGKANSSDFDQGVKVADSPEFEAVTAGTITVRGSGAGNLLLIESGASVQFQGVSAGSILSFDAYGSVVALPSGSSGQVLVSSSSAYAWGTLTPSDVGAAAVSHSHSASDVTSGVFDVARIPQFDVRADTVSSTSYIGRAVSGSATSASVWKIRRTVYSSAGAVSSTGTATNVKWNDRLTATYS